MTTETQHLATSAGRRLAYTECGDPRGYRIIYCHGFPSTSLEVQLVHPMALAARARIVAPDRPGCGDSSFRPLGRIADWADDVVSLTDALQIERFAILGVVLPSEGHFSLPVRYGEAILNDLVRRGWR